MIIILTSNVFFSEPNVPQANARNAQGRWSEGPSEQVPCLPQTGTQAEIIQLYLTVLTHWLIDCLPCDCSPTFNYLVQQISETHKYAAIFVIILGHNNVCRCSDIPRLQKCAFYTTKVHYTKVHYSIFYTLKLPNTVPQWFMNDPK